MKRYALVLVLLLLAAVPFLGRTLSAHRPSDPRDLGHPVDQTAADRHVDPRVVSGSNQLGFRALAELARRSPKKNVFISPTSIELALAMTYNGANGRTRDEMAKTLGLDGMDLGKVNEGFASLTGSLKNADPQVELSIANSLWARKGISFNPDFMGRVRTSFEAELSDLSGAPGSINDWVSLKTKGRIPRIVDQIDVSTALILVNATYFKGKWADPFEPTDTSNREFHRPDGISKVPTMFRGTQMAYLRKPDFQAVRLPYGSGRLAMYVILPRQGLSAVDLCAGIDELKWNQLTGALRKTSLMLYLPKCHFEWEASLKGTLRALGMKTAFDALSADFSGMAPIKPLWVSDVLHKTFVDVDEEGTEAAAATSVIMAAGCASPAHPQEKMIVDRPFLCAIVDDRTKTVIFAGVISDPSQAHRD